MNSAPLPQIVTISRVKNASGWASYFKSRWITPGLVNYDDTGAGVGYVSREAIDRSMQTMVGRPLVIKHEPISSETGQKLDPVTPQNMDEVDKGFISRVWWGDDGWAWCEGTVHDDEAKRLIKSGWKVSCCYASRAPLGPRGKLQGMPYDFEIRDFNGEHLALHPNPRYEGATIIMNARATGKPSTTMKFTLFGKKKEPAADPAAAAAAQAAADKRAADDAAEATRLENARKEATEITPETVVEYAEGKTATFAEMADSHVRVLNGLELDPEEEIEYAPGKREKAGKIMNAYKAAMESEEKRVEDEKTKNAELEQENKRRLAEGTTTGTAGLSFTKNGKDAVVKAGERSPNYLRLVNAADTHVTRQLLKNAGKQPETQQARIERGVKRWGTPPKLAAGKN